MRSSEGTWKALHLVLRDVRGFPVSCGLVAGSFRAQEGADLGQQVLGALLQEAKCGRELSSQKILLFREFLLVDGPASLAVTWDNYWGLCGERTGHTAPLRLVFRVVTDQTIREAVWRFLEAVAQVGPAQHVPTPMVLPIGQTIEA